MTRTIERSWIARALLLVAAACLSAHAVNADSLVREVQSVAVTVSDLDKSVAFYRDVLGFTAGTETEVAGENYEHLYGVFGARIRSAPLSLGKERLMLVQFLAPRGRPMPIDSHGNDQWFQHVAIIVSDMDRAYRTLREHNVEHASTGPQVLPVWNKNAGGISAFYFRDPDGHFLEILHFPPGKGDPKWQQHDRLFLGIDHTAIVVHDTDASLKFYRDTLGLKIVGESENYGTEQEHLNNVFGARLRITTLHADSGPGVELLEYLAPRTGRSFPADSAVNDLWHWHVNMRTEATEEQTVASTRTLRYVSSGIVRFEDRTAGVLVRDPDGHAAMLLH
jgi:catechol 2,3-dioxygenase-like lactoylglutathione lyase family enzyme